MNPDPILSTMFLIFTGAAVLSTVVLFTRQSLLVAYILLGAAFGPFGFKLVTNTHLIHHISEVGIIFLLFLLGLHLQPQNLLHMLKKATWITITSSVSIAGLTFVVSRLFGFHVSESLVVAAAMMFSSTIIGLKLLPTTILHHQHIGEIMISVLLMQDLIAIIVLLLLHGFSGTSFTTMDAALIIIGLPGLIAFAFLVERYILAKLFAKFDQTQEYIFLLSIGWCLGMAELAKYLGLSEEIGAFIAGVALAAGPISLFIAESLKPLRDFFLIMFFFSLGAAFDFQYLSVVIVPALCLATLMLVIKPTIFYFLLSRAGESKAVSREVGVRLGQASEFSLLVSAAATSSALLTTQATYFIQATTLITFIVSSYLVVLRYPTPIALTDKMRRD